MMRALVSLGMIVVLAGGCGVAVRPRDLSAAAQPMPEARQFVGTYSDTPSEQHGSGASLWRVLVNRDHDEPLPDGVRQTRIELAANGSLVAIWLVDGTEVRRSELALKFRDGYLFSGQRPTLKNVHGVFNIAGENSIGVGLDQRDDMVVVHRGSGTLFIVVAPIFAADGRTRQRFQRQQ